MILFYKILNCQNAKYIFDVIPESNDCCCNTKASSKSEILEQKKSFSNTFFLFCIKEGSKLDAKIRNLSSISRFKKLLLIYFQTDENSI